MSPTEAKSKPRIFTGIKKVGSFLGVQTEPAAPAMPNVASEAPLPGAPTVPAPTPIESGPTNPIPEVPVATIVPVEPPPVAEVASTPTIPTPDTETPVMTPTVPTAEVLTPVEPPLSEPTVVPVTPDPVALAAEDLPKPQIDPLPTLSPVLRPKPPVMPQNSTEEPLSTSVQSSETEESPVKNQTEVPMEITQNSVFWANPEAFRTPDGRLDKEKLGKVVKQLEFVQKNPDMVPDLESAGISVPKAA